MKRWYDFLSSLRFTHLVQLSNGFRVVVGRAVWYYEVFGKRGGRGERGARRPHTRRIDATGLAR